MNKFALCFLAIIGFSSASCVPTNTANVTPSATTVTPSASSVPKPKPSPPPTLVNPVKAIAVIPADTSLNTDPLEDYFISELIDRNYSVVPRTNIQKILEEENFQNTNLTERVVERIKLAGADSLFIFRRSHYGHTIDSEYSYQIISISDGLLMKADHTDRYAGRIGMSGFDLMLESIPYNFLTEEQLK